MREWSSAIHIHRSTYCIEWKMNRTFVNLHINQNCENPPISIPMKKEHAADNFGLADDRLWKLLFPIDCFDRPIIRRSVVSARGDNGVPGSGSIFFKVLLLYLLLFDLDTCRFADTIKNKSNKHAIFWAIYDIRTSNNGLNSLNRSIEQHPSRKQNNTWKEHDRVSFQAWTIAGVVLHFLQFLYCMNTCHRLWSVFLDTLLPISWFWQNRYIQREKLMTAFILLFTLIQMGNKHKIMIKRLWLNELTVLARSLVRQCAYACWLAQWWICTKSYTALIDQFLW